MTEPDPKLLIGPTRETAYSLFSDTDPASQPYEMYVSGDGTSFGNSESITRVVETFLTDLQYVVIDGQGPREMTFTVWVTGEDDRVLARAEADLMAQLYKPNKLWWRPPRADAPWAFFEVANSSLKIGEIGENDFEEAHLWRKYTVTLTCGAWVSSAVEELATMGTSGDLSITLNAGSETGVSLASLHNVTAVMDDSSGDLVVSFTPSAVTLPADRRGAVAFTGFTIDPAATPLIVVDMYYEGPYTNYRGAFVSSAGGANVEMYVEAVVPQGPGHDWVYYSVPAGAVWDRVLFTYLWPLLMLTPGPELTYVSLKAIDATARIGTLRQKMFSLDVKGSVPARGAIEVANADDPLSSALVYSFVDPAGTYMPVLGPGFNPTFSTSGIRTSDANTASGSKVQLDNGETATYFMPLEAFPDGTYDIVMKARGAAGIPAHVSVIVEVHISDAVPVQLPAFTPTFDYTADGSYRFYTVGQISLPLLRTKSISGSAALVIFVVNATSGETAVWDDIYLMNIDIGAYTILKDLGPVSDPISPAKPNFLSLESPTFEWPTQSVMVGVAGAEYTHYAPAGAKVKAVGRHELQPGRNKVLVVTDAIDSVATARYYPRGHTNLEW